MEESAWVVEDVNDSDVLPSLVDDADPDDRNDQTPGADQEEVKLLKKRKRIEAMKHAAKRGKTEKYRQNVMRDAEFCPPAGQAEAFHRLLDCGELEKGTGDDFIPLSPSTQLNIRELGKIVGAIKAMQPQWKEKFLGGGDRRDGPIMLVITYSAIRAVDIVRALKYFQNGKLLIAKLFAKHMKVNEQVTTLEGDVRIAVGTPNRLLKLYDAGALTSSCLEHVIIDMGRDVKSMNLFDMDDVKNDFVELFRKYMAQETVSRGGKLRLCLY